MSTQKNYKAYEKQYADLEKERQELKKRKAKIEARFEQLKMELSSVKRELGAALADGFKGEEMKEIEEGRDKISQEFKKYELAAPAIIAKFEKLNEEIQEAVNQKNEAFADLAEAWLEKEVKNYDKKAQITLVSLRRLLVAHRLLREAGHSDRYRNVVGPGFEFLPQARVPVLADFKKADFLKRIRSDNSQTHEKIIFSEIINSTN